jgi:hypothetical protein
MPSLSAHLRLPEDHSRLPFHPACPVCRRDRLAGSLDGDELVSRRTQAAIAAGLLAFSSIGVPAAVASEPDNISEGTSEAVVGGDPSVSPELDLGTETAQLPDEAASAPDVVAPATDEDSGPLEPEPAMDVQEPVVDATEDVAPAPAEPTPVPQPEMATPEPSAVATPPAASAAPSAPQESRISAKGTRPRKALETVVRTKPRTEPSIAEPAPAPPIPAAEPAPAPPTTVHVVARSNVSRISPGDRIHVVRRGESLWSIASDLLGGGATVARVAREVNRLWELNEERIGTGRPDLLFAGTRLELR